MKFLIEVNSPQEVREEFITEIERRIVISLNEQKKRMNQAAIIDNASRIKTLRELKDFLIELVIKDKSNDNA